MSDRLNWRWADKSFTDLCRVVDFYTNPDLLDAIAMHAAGEITGEELDDYYGFLVSMGLEACPPKLRRKPPHK